MSRNTLYKILFFLLGALYKINVNLIGVVTLSEIVLLCAFPLFLVFKDSSFVKESNRSIYLIFLLWGISVIISDAFNNTSILNFLKGIAVPLFTFISFIVFNKILQKNLKPLFGFVLGMFFASCINYFIDVEAYQFRFGLFPIIVSGVGIFSFVFWKKKPSLVIGLYFFLGIVGLLSGSRSSSIMFILSAVLMFYIYRRRGTSKLLTFSSRRIITIVVGLLVGIISIQSFYVWAVENKLFPEEYQQKYEMQMARGVPVIFSGRTEIFASTKAIKDAPILGHGSWAVDTKYTLLELRSIGERIKNRHQFAHLKTNRIPAHSFLLGTWVYSGILGMFFFIYFLIFLYRGLMYYINNWNNSFLPVNIYFIVSYTWHTFFSPLGLHQRMFVGLLLAISSVLWSKYKGQRIQLRESNN